ncbi:MAG: DUF4332 domain-containing protein [Anaerolineales bacterium]
MTKLASIEGIGPVYQEKLAQAGIRTVEKLLEVGKTPKGRAQLSEETGISGKLLLEWINHADLFRIKGIGEEYSDLLEEAGVDTVPELAQRRPDSLYAKLVEINAEQRLVRRLPPQVLVEDWIAQAQELPRIIEY